MITKGDQEQTSEKKLNANGTEKSLSDNQKDVKKPSNSKNSDVK